MTASSKKMFIVVLLVLLTSGCKSTDPSGADATIATGDQSGDGPTSPPTGIVSPQPTDVSNSPPAPSPTGIDNPPPAPPPTDTSNPTASPKISNFSATASAIDQGGSTVLKWQVAGADRIVIEPDIGIVNGNKLRIFPQETKTYTLTASAEGSSTTAKLVVQVLSQSGDWQVTEVPPQMSNVKFIDMSRVEPRRIQARDIHCAGLIRRVTLDNDVNAIVYMSGAKSLRYPVHITGGNNVRVVGLQIDIDTQPGCGVGELPNRPIKDHPNSNIHPRIPGAVALRLQQWGTSFIEGVNIDVRGHQADCIVSRNPDELDNSRAVKQRDFVVQNSVCAGVEGMGKTAIGDGIHGDLFQNQGNDVLRRLVFENVSHRTSQQGIVLHADGFGRFPATKELVIRNYDYSWDARYVGDDSYETFGLAFSGKPGSNWTLENIRIDDYRDGGDYIMINGQRYGDSPKKSVKSHPEIRSGLPPMGAFALPERTGVNYQSPHGGVPNK